MSLGRARFSILAVACLSLIAATRIPLAPGQLFSFDDVNFAYAIGEFNIAKSQPQPPGYPLFVLETRILSWLRFKRAESNFLALSILGSTASVIALVYLGRRMFGFEAGLIAGIFLLFHHSFWYGGLTSALRPQLALISIVVAGACYRAWAGERPWIYWSAIVLGLGAGIRPELGPLLLPLWLVSMMRATRRIRDWVAAPALLTATVCAWLLPTMLSSGGVRTYTLLCWQYLTDQASLTSGAFGAHDERWYGTICWLLVWSLSTILALPAAAILAWRAGAGRSVARSKVAFLLLWFTPPFVFAIFVHIADPGQALTMVPVVCLIAGYLISRAMDGLAETGPRWQPAVFSILPLSLALIPVAFPPGWLIAAVPAGCTIVGILLRRKLRGPSGERLQSLPFLLSPALFLNASILFQPVWYYSGPPTHFHRILRDLHSGLSATSLVQIRRTVSVDDHTLREIGRLASERPGRSVVLWESGPTTWRKINYYHAKLPVIVLETKKLSPESPPVATLRQGPVLVRRIEYAPPVRIDLQPGTRLIAVLNPKTPFFRLLLDRFKVPIVAEPYHVYSIDLPASKGEARLGNYTLSW